MSELFLKIINMSISASWLVLVVLALRFVFKKAPKWVNVLLWGIVAVRLICPFSIESGLSLIPSAETIPLNIEMDTTPAIDSGISAINNAVNPAISHSNTPAVGASINPLQITVGILANIWLLGAAAMLLYTAISYRNLQRRVSEAVILRDNIFQSENVGSPFVLGIIRPRIYLPYHMDEQDLEHVVAHERAHIRRKDHLWKPLGFLLLTVHWFNPLMWLAYVLLCRDIELACDEKVIRELGNEQRADYSQALVACSVNRPMIAACPLAFGEVGVKERVKSVLNYKKPAFWVIVVSVVACVVVAVCFLTNPVGFRFDEASHTIVSANHFDARSGGDPVVSEMNLAQISELSSRLAGVKNTKKSSQFGGFTPGYQISARLQDGTYIRISGYSLSQNDMVDIEWNGERYVVSDSRFQDYLSRICAAEDTAAAVGAISGKTYIYEKEGIMGDFTITLYDDGTFSYYEGMASSYLGFGSWKQEGETITLTDDGHGGSGLVNRFVLDKTDLLFVEKGSSNFIYVQVQNGERFFYTGDSVKPEETVQTDTPRTLSLDDIVALSGRGYDLTWADFTPYRYITTGSGLYIQTYEINEMFTLHIGGIGTEDTPMYIYLALADDPDTRIDIRDGGVEEFIHRDHSETLLDRAVCSAILDHNKRDMPDGLFHCASFVQLAKEEISGTPTVGSTDHTGAVTVYGFALHQAFSLSGGTPTKAMGSHIPVAITFSVRSGKYEVLEYWEPRDGNNHMSDIREKFPDEVEEDALDTQKYILAQKQACYAQVVESCGIDANAVIEDLFEVMESSPLHSSRPGDYIDAHPIEYRELTYYDRYTLRYCFEQFLRGDQIGLRGHLMRSLLDELAPESRLRLLSMTGQEYFDAWQAEAIRLNKEHGAQWLLENHPAMHLLLEMTDSE